MCHTPLLAATSLSTLKLKIISLKESAKRDMVLYVFAAAAAATAASAVGDVE